MAPLFSIGLISGIVMFITGFILNYKINRRRFYRRTITGLEVFRSYENIPGAQGCLNGLENLLRSF
jgi:hypothetical protein